MIRLVYNFISASLVLLASHGLLSAEPHHHHHGAHVHGAATLLLAIENKSLQVELNSPAMNIVGFEHKPKNQKQKAAVKQAIKLLQTADNVFNFTGEANCKLRDVRVESGLNNEGHRDSLDHGSEHNEFQASYVFNCSDPSALKQIDVNLFKHFPSLENIRVEMITDKGQTATTLTHKHHRLKL